MPLGSSQSSLTFRMRRNDLKKRQLASFRLNVQPSITKLGLENSLSCAIHHKMASLLNVHIGREKNWS
jgi:hypothetical protein